MLSVIEQFGINGKLVLAEAVNFLVVLGILYYFVFRKVATFLDERNKTIQTGVENAQKAEETLAGAELEKAQILTDAEKEASQNISESVTKAKERESEILSSANDKAGEILEESKKRGEAEKQSIIDSSSEEIAKMITLGAEKVLKGK